MSSNWFCDLLEGDECQLDGFGGGGGGVRRFIEAFPPMAVDVVGGVNRRTMVGFIIAIALAADNVAGGGDNRRIMFGVTIAMAEAAAADDDEDDPDDKRLKLVDAAVVNAGEIGELSEGVVGKLRRLVFGATTPFTDCRNFSTRELGIRFS